jgi:crotonobetaine/carnitine-CoA ligase
MIDFPIEDRTIGNVLRAAVEARPDAPFILHRDECFSYADMELMSTRLAHGLKHWGVETGARVALMLENSPEYVISLFALNKLKALSVPINTAARGELLRYFVCDLGSTHVIVQDDHLEVLKEALGPDSKIRICVMPTRGFGTTRPAGYPVWQDLLDDGLSARGGSLDLTAKGWDPWLVLYTSGTTGPSKGNVCPNAHSLSIARLQTERMQIDPSDRMYTFLPLFHGNALNYSTLTALWGGAAIALEPRFSASRFWADIHKYQATQFNAMMIVTSILEKLPPSPEEADNPVRLAMMVPPPANRRELEDRWGLKIISQYAMSEASPIAVLDAGDAYEKPRTSGKLVDHLDIRIVDDNDVEVPTGTAGEVIIRPRDPWTIFSEYYGKPEATARAFRNLWFHTGDRAYVDEDRYLYFVDRVKDAIRRRGENISAYEIEMIMQKNPRIREIAAVPAPSEMGEDEVAVFVVRADPDLTEAEVIDYAVAQMAYFMVPRYVAFVDEMPKTPSQKIQKMSLREKARTEYRTMWDRVAAGIKIDRFTARSPSRSEAV